MTQYVAPAAGDSQPAKTVTGVAQASINHGVITLATALASADTVALMKLPAGHIPVDFILDSDDLDTGGSPEIVLKAGLLDEDSDGDEFIASTNIGQAGGVARLSEAKGRRIAPSDKDRLVGITVSTAPATGATGVKVAGTLISRPAAFED